MNTSGEQFVIDDVEFQRSEIISDLWKDLADNEKTGEFIIHDRCVYDMYDPITGETYLIVPTVRGGWFMGCMVSPLSMRDLAKTFVGIQPKGIDAKPYSNIVLDHVNKCKSVFRDINEKLEDIDIYDIMYGSTLEPRSIHDKNHHTNWAPTKRQCSAIKGKNNPFR